MRVVIQRVKQASVKVDDNVVGKVDEGLCILVGFTKTDSADVIKKMVKKIVNLRIFDDELGIMNKSILDIGGSILSVSQFTLYADTRNGNRPSYAASLGRNDAIILYEMFNQQLKAYNINVETGSFGAEMDVFIHNDGPVTIVIDSEE